MDVLEIVETAFTTGELPVQLTWSLLVIIPKPSGGVRGIGLLETVWKLIKTIDGMKADRNDRQSLPRSWNSVS